MASRHDHLDNIITLTHEINRRALRMTYEELGILTSQLIAFIGTIPRVPFGETIHPAAPEDSTDA